MEPSKVEPDPNPSVVPPLPLLTGRLSISIEPFRAVALEIANTFGEPVAICLRKDDEQGAVSVPFRNQLLSSARKAGCAIAEIIYPSPSDSQL